MDRADVPARKVGEATLVMGGKRILSAVARAVTSVEGLWFDWTRRVQTSGQALLSEMKLAGSVDDGFMYLPARVASVRRAFAAISTLDHSAFTFIDLGSGKGRTLLVAAEYPFRRIVGVEFAQELHEQAESNVRRHNCLRCKCGNIELVHADAQEFQIPEENLVLFLFNPFPAKVLDRVLSNVERSLRQRPRQVFLIYLFPEYAAQVDSVPWLSLVDATRRHRIFRAALIDIEIRVSSPGYGFPL